MTDLSSPPRVVALLPAWNAESFIEASLRALAGQTCQNFSVVISVDQSTDDTARVCRAFAETDERFTVVEQQQRLGWTGNVAALLELADADYFLFACHDDVPLPSHATRLVALLETNPQAVIAYSDIKAHFTFDRVDDCISTELDREPDAARRAESIIRRRGQWWTPVHGVFRAATLRKVGPFRRHRAGEFSADWPWLLRMALNGEFIRAPEFLMDKYYKTGSLSHEWRGASWELAGVVEDCARAVVSSDLPVAEKLRLVALTAGVAAKEEARKRAPSLAGR